MSPPAGFLSRASFYVGGWYRYAVSQDDGFADLPPFFPTLQVFRPYDPLHPEKDPTRCRCGASWRDPACYCGV